MKTKYYFLLWVLVFASTKGILGQGCSDAGFCSMGALRPNQTLTIKSKIEIVALEMGYSFAESIKGDYIQQLSFDALLNLGKKNRVQIRLPYVFTQGRLGNTQGIGDLTISFSRPLYRNEWRSLLLTIGTKLPLGQTNLLATNQLPLPMYYQNGLGTWDFIAGLSWQTRSWLLAIAYQIPLLHSNQNTFTASSWRDTDEAANAYPNSYQIKRGADLMVRIEKNFRFHRFNYFVGVLPVLRLYADRVYDPLSQQETEITGSKGVSINWQTGIGYQFSYHITAKILLSRQKYREQTGMGKTAIPDGLHREWLMGTSIFYRF